VEIRACTPVLREITSQMGRFLELGRNSPLREFNDCIDYAGYDDSPSMMEIPQLSDLKQLLSASALQHQVVSHNLANTNTPGFQRKQVDFAAVVSQLDAPASKAMASGHAPIVVDQTAAPRRDGNTVDPDREISELTKNTMRYQTLLQLAAHQLEQLQIAIGQS
jgi:flagellar basal-body rod protein FlgB